MGTKRPPLVLDTGALVTRFLPEDPAGEPLRAFLEEQRRHLTFGHLVTVDVAVGEGYTLLRREVGLARAREFLAFATAAEHPRVLHVDWHDVAGLLCSAPEGRVGKGFTFVDASLVVAAQALGARHILTVNPRDFRPFGLTPLPAS